MAFDEFGGIIQESAPQGVQVDEFGGIISSQPTFSEPKPSPTAEQDAFIQQYIQAGTLTPTQQVIQALMAPPKAGWGLLKGITDIGVKGVQGAGALLGETSFNPSEGIGNTIQTVGEIGPRLIYELGNAGRQVLQSPESMRTTGESLARIANPLGTAISALINPQLPPTEAQAQQAFEDQIRNQIYAQQGEQGIAEVLQRDLGLPTVGTANIDVARAAPLLLGAETAVTKGIPALGRGLTSVAGRVSPPLEAIASRGVFSKPLEDAITRTTGITASEGSLEAAPIVKTRISELPGKPPTTGKEFVEVANKAQTSTLQDALVPLREAEKSGLVMKGDSMISSGRQAVLNDFPSLANDVQAIDNVLAEFSYLKGDLKPTQGQGFLRELNRRYNGLENKNSPAASAYRAIRSELSNQTDEIIKAQTGKDISPYRDWGQLEEFKNGVQNQITAAQRTQGGRELPAGGIPAPSRGGLIRAARSLPVARAFVPRAIESVDQGVRRILREVKSLPKASDLGDDAINSLRSKYQPSPISMETQIQELIASYPQNIRSNPSLARAVAEAELAGQSTPLP